MKSVPKLLKENPILRWFSAGSLVSHIGDAFEAIALPWLGLSLGGPRALGLIFLCYGLPRVPAAPFVGRLLDRFGARALLIADNAGRGCVIALVPVLGWAHLIGVWQLCLIAAAAGILSQCSDVGEYLVTPALVEDADLTTANSLVSFSNEAAGLLGPAAAGLLFNAAGYEAAFLCDVLSFAVMAYAATRLPRHISADPSQPRPGLWQVTSGFRKIARMPVVLAMTVISVLFLMLSGMMEVAWPDYSKYTLHTSAGGFGILMTFAALGATLGVLALPRWLAGLGARTALALVLLAQGLLFLPFLLIRTLPAALGFAFPVYFFMMFYTFERTILQRAVPAGIRGEVIGARRGITACGYPLGAAAAGVMAGAWGAIPLFAVVGLGMCVLAVGVSVTPALRDADSSDKVPEGEGSSDTYQRTSTLAD